MKSEISMKYIIVRYSLKLKKKNRFHDGVPKNCDSKKVWENSNHVDVRKDELNAIILEC